MNTTFNDPLSSDCSCEDADLPRLWDLTSAGLDCRSACERLWGSPLADLRAWAVERTRARFPWYSEAGRVRDVSGLVMLLCAVLFVAVAVWWGWL
ncbi:MAG TPA: hypothetical protein VFJ14_06825 [Nocardioidaceae bacterium]|nr:hypothetical protein [Nocardioidaceae bacterium]